MTPRPSFVWSTNFDSLENLDNGNRDSRGRYSIVEDPTGSGRGKVLRCEAAPDLAYFDPQYPDGGQTVVRSYPAIYFPALEGPHSASVDVLVSADFVPIPDYPHQLGLLSDFYDTGSYGTAWRYTAGVILDMKQGVHVLRLHITDPVGFVTPVAGAPSFTFNKWHRIEIVFGRDRHVTLLQDGQVVAIGHLPDGLPLATAGGHPGLYGLFGPGQRGAPFSAGTLLNDNWTMIVWP